MEIINCIFKHNSRNQDHKRRPSLKVCKKEKDYVHNLDWSSAEFWVLRRFLPPNLKLPNQLKTKKSSKRAQMKLISLFLNSKSNVVKSKRPKRNETQPTRNEYFMNFISIVFFTFYSFRSFKSFLQMFDQLKL